jgi:hypothetical protein
MNGFTATTKFNVGDLLLLKLNNNSLSGAPAVNTNTVPRPNIWYKIIGVNSTSITVDRKLPNYSSQNSYLSELITYKSRGL